MKICPDPNPAALTPIYAYALDAAFERTPLDHEKTRHAEIKRSAQEGFSIQTR